jgi:hypothetical protein
MQLDLSRADRTRRMGLQEPMHELQVDEVVKEISTQATGKNYACKQSCGMREARVEGVDGSG